MRYKSFEIQNFKGIKHAKINFSENLDARIYTLVGLNEGGKTTVLEAIHAFMPDAEAGRVIEKDGSTYQWLKEAVPRSKIADFSGNVSVKATVFMDETDQKNLVEWFNKSELAIDPLSIPNEFTFERYAGFRSGESTGSFYKTNLKIRVKDKGKRSFRETIKKEDESIRDFLYQTLPAVAYFPTFVFDFPDRIYLSGRAADPKNDFYRRLFQDILDYSGQGYKIEDHIVKRFRKPEYIGAFASIFDAWNKGKERQQIAQVIDFAAKTVTKIILENGMQFSTSK